MLACHRAHASIAAGPDQSAACKSKRCSLLGRRVCICIMLCGDELSFLSTWLQHNRGTVAASSKGRENLPNRDQDKGFNCPERTGQYALSNSNICRSSLCPL